jgi:uncharacterized membrane protein
MLFFIFILFVLLAGYHFIHQKLEDRLLSIEKEIKKLKKDYYSLSEHLKDIKKHGLAPEKDIALKKEEPASPIQPLVREKEMVDLPQPPVMPPKPDIPPPPPIPSKPDMPPPPIRPSNEYQSPWAAIREEKLKDLPKSIPPRQPAWELKWEEFKKNVDWEQFTGVNLFAWLGGLALFIGAVFFVKYSIDNNLIPAQVRLAIGALTGLVMIVSSLKIDRNRYEMTAHTMAAGGIAVLYAISFATTVYYGFIPQLAGFGLFSLISAAAFVLAVFHKSRFISILGALGAYATPILIRTGHPNLLGLFVYLSVVNIGLFEVMRRTAWLPLSVLTTVGTLLTLSAGAWGPVPHAENELICTVAIANLVFFSVFFRFYRGENAGDKSIILSIRILFASMLLLALAIMGDPGWLQLLLITSGILVAQILAYEEGRWSDDFIYYNLAGFILTVLWVLTKFDLQEPSWGMVMFFAYGLIAGIGPLFIIRKYGVKLDTLNWLKAFPVVVAIVGIAAFLMTPAPSFWFWPMIIGLTIMGIFIGLIVESLLSIVILTLALLTGGIGWVLKTPVLLIGSEFFIMVLCSGLILCFFTLLFLKIIRIWNPLEVHGKKGNQPTPAILANPELISTLPVLGPFLLLSLVLFRQHPSAPNPGMACALCFFAAAIYLSWRIRLQVLIAVTLAAMAMTEISWGLLISRGDTANQVLLGWSTFLWLVAVVLPNLTCRPEKEWNIGWYAWAIFELVQSLFIIRTTDALWEREIIGWLPLVLAILKLPIVSTLLKRLEGDSQRNPILAFHGGVLLFYVSSVAVLLLANAWLGMALVVEAMLLLWLNRRIEHPGLRWVSFVLAPTGLLLLYFHINTLKTAQDLPVLNAATLSFAVCVLALGISVKWSAFPRKELSPNLSLPAYFLCLSVGTGFFLLNLMVADIFGGVGGGFKVIPEENIAQYISYSLLWSIFGATLFRMNNLLKGLRFVGLCLTLVGAIFTMYLPIQFQKEIGLMMPFFNLGLLAFIPIIYIAAYLALKHTEKDPGGEVLRDFFIVSVLLVGFVTLTVELSTVFQNGVPFVIFSKYLPGMELAVIVSWFIYGLALLAWPRPLNNHFRTAGAVLVMISILKACFYPLLYADEFGAVTPLLNVPALVYLSIIVALTVLTIKKLRQDWVLPQSFDPRFFWGGILTLFAFYVTNVEVASWFGIFSTGEEAGRFSFFTHGRLSHQLAYSISWLLFALGLLAIGIRWKLIYVRWVGLGLIVITVLKVFFKDLWVLGQLYRVGSFIGLAVTLMLVSFLYQRYLTDNTKKGEAE